MEEEKKEPEDHFPEVQEYLKQYLPIAAVVILIALGLYFGGTDQIASFVTRR